MTAPVFQAVRKTACAFAWALLILAAAPLPAQKPAIRPRPAEQQQKKEQETAPPASGEAPIIANICPRFVLLGVPRRIKFFGAYFSDPLIQYEDEDLEFRDYKVDPDGHAFTVVVEAKREAQTGKRVIAIEGQSEFSREPNLYVLKREDRALLQRDLVRCPEMKDEVETPDPKKSPRPARPPKP